MSEDLFDKFREPTPGKQNVHPKEQYPADEELDDARETKRNRLLRAFKSGEWFTTNQLVDIAGHRFSTHIDALRQRGHVIEKVVKDAKTSGGCCYRWRAHREVWPTSYGWQEAYYRSTHWAVKRAARLKFDAYGCCRCHQEATVVHHWRYVLFAEPLSDLMGLCGGCHEYFHDQLRCDAFPKFVSVDFFKRLPGWELMLPKQLRDRVA